FWYECQPGSSDLEHRPVADRLAENLDRSADDREGTRDRPEGGRLAGAVRPEQGDDLAGVDSERQVSHCGHSVVPGKEASYPNLAHGACASSSSLTPAASVPRYASMTAALARTSSGFPSVIIRPNSRT